MEQLRPVIAFLIVASFIPQPNAELGDSCEKGRTINTFEGYSCGIPENGQSNQGGSFEIELKTFVSL